ncbi:GT2 family glycosyltransferase [Dysgonomonas sp. PFB1-18]|uniref:glycosyltransferase family 2 protein n=1 Tax=unclassified Dysgonomonas TaxID=2630389 RepID=UPI002475EE24|nr:MULTISPECIES: glycosyltransferase family 2 protein [unclassified Dysgonomonas]MDH6309762.1 GT2 family glycosyltransferase [Dysgonomonas sp. PF1-14]MDH6339230.1 GT2 family glycosyltransferase [Dysgonomonas sp. PF1-16]MDH6380729.1 GT2 family glycosyltransferase [Dysgonomonas sp. PFB1-18]MDH6398225.1 GT2 family glycosyltransferase [Dysgonomonas sp. PF1-23]
MKKVAVVILNWNGKELLEEFLPSVLQYTTHPDVEIVVADNGSTDDSLLFLENTYPPVTRIVLPQNYGFADGYNRALREIDAKYFVLLNSDVEVTDNWLIPVIEYLDTHRDIAAAQPKIRAQRNKPYFEYAGASGGFIDKYGYPFCRGRIFQRVEEDLAQYDEPIDVLWATGACLIIRSEEFFTAGGFDASFFAHMEEIDLCWRLNCRGKRIVCLPFSTVYHVGAATLKKESPRKTFLNFRNNLLMLYKNLPQKHLKRVMIIRLILDYIAAVQFTLTGKYANAKEVIRAHKDFYDNRRNYRSARQENLTKRTVNQVKTIYPKSVLAAYYLRFVRVYSKLKSFN